ncbi:MAG: DHHA1 domain-containing protein, partial [Oscillospiraceae bacterium]
EFTSKCNVIALAYDGEFCDVVAVDENPKEDVLVVLDRTPFYAEAGGQIADTGVIKTETGELKVLDCRKTAKGFYVHTCTLEKGFVKVMTQGVAEVDPMIRNSIQRNHTAAHLLQAALRFTLGNHVHQSGSYVAAGRLRFDFTHFTAVTAEELSKIEAIVNGAILKAIDVETSIMDIDEAKKSGAMALFGEKYGSVVRVLKIDDVSTELCGGTHVKNTSQIGLFRIVSESGVAAGVRRIEAVTGIGVLQLLQEKQDTIDEAAKNLKLSNSHELAAKTLSMMLDMKAMQSEIESLKAEVAKGQIAGLFENPIDVAGLKVFTGYFGGTSGDALRQMCSMIRDKVSCCVAVLCGEQDGKVTIAAMCGAETIEKGIKAGALVKAVAAVTGGSGGGKPDFAMAGVKDVNLVDEALAKVPEIIKTLL